MKTQKEKVCLSIDMNASCILGTLANEFGCNKSELVEFLLYSAGYNRFGSEGLNASWRCPFVPGYLDHFVSQYDADITLKDVIYDCLIDSSKEI